MEITDFNVLEVSVLETNLQGKKIHFSFDLSGTDVFGSLSGVSTLVTAEFEVSFESTRRRLVVSGHSLLTETFFGIKTCREDKIKVESCTAKESDKRVIAQICKKTQWSPLVSECEDSVKTPTETKHDLDVIPPSWVLASVIVFALIFIVGAIHLVTDPQSVMNLMKNTPT